MLKKIILVVLTASSVCSANGGVDYNPRYYQIIEDPEYIGPDSRYQGENWPSRPFFIGELCAFTSEPRFGYPLSRSVQLGVNDTLAVKVDLRNQTGVDYVLGTGDYPQDWIVPKLFDPRADVRKERARLDTNYFDYQFFGWWAGRSRWQIPTTIDTTGGRLPTPQSNLSLQYYLWNIPPGTYRVIMEVTEEAPTGFKMMNGWGPEIIIIDSAKTMADTINAWVACFWRAFWNRDSIAAMAWVDTILTYNPKSIAGYRLIAEVTRMNPFMEIEGDTLYAMQALDSVQKFIANYEDPALPDSANLNDQQKAWMYMVGAGARFFQRQARDPSPFKRTEW